MVKSKRNANIRKACDQIKGIVMIENSDAGYLAISRSQVEKVHKILYRIKRTTWRGKEKKINKQRIKPNVSY